MGDLAGDRTCAEGLQGSTAVGRCRSGGGKVFNQFEHFRADADFVVRPCASGTDVAIGQQLADETPSDGNQLISLSHRHLSDIIRDMLSN